LRVTSTRSSAILGEVGEEVPALLVGEANTSSITIGLSSLSERISGFRGGRLPETAVQTAACGETLYLSTIDKLLYEKLGRDSHPAKRVVLGHLASCLSIEN
jgi:hypothetical protein